MHWPLPIRTPESVGLKVHQSSEPRWLFPVAWQRQRNFRGQPLTTGPLGAEPEYVPQHSSAPSTHSVSVSLHCVRVHAQVNDLHITHTSLQGQQMDCCVQIWHSMGCPCVSVRACVTRPQAEMSFCVTQYGRRAKCPRHCFALRRQNQLQMYDAVDKKMLIRHIITDYTALNTELNISANCPFRPYTWQIHVYSLCTQAGNKSRIKINKQNARLLILLNCNFK